MTTAVATPSKPAPPPATVDLDALRKMLPEGYALVPTAPTHAATQPRDAATGLIVLPVPADPRHAFYAVQCAGWEGYRPAFDRGVQAQRCARNPKKPYVHPGFTTAHNGEQFEQLCHPEPDCGDDVQTRVWQDADRKRLDQRYSEHPGVAALLTEPPVVGVALWCPVREPDPGLRTMTDHGAYSGVSGPIGLLPNSGGHCPRCERDAHNKAAVRIRLAKARHAIFERYQAAGLPAPDGLIEAVQQEAGIREVAA